MMRVMHLVGEMQDGEEDLLLGGSAQIDPFLRSVRARLNLIETGE